jgi:hypothetical protein
MQTLYPERIIAIWLRSGTAYPLWEGGVVPKATIPEAAYQIPVMCNPGVKEKSDSRFDMVWTGSLSMFHAYRAKGAPIGFAPDPRTSHECGDSRYLAIPFFDACLKARLPRKAGAPLRKVSDTDAWLAQLQGTTATAASDYSGTAREAIWLPNQAVAKAWEEYVRTGGVGDTTPPPAPFNVEATPVAGGTLVRWEARADFESGLRSFVILKDGKELAQFPSTPVGPFGRPLFQTMSYHDTPEASVPGMEFLDKGASAGSAARYRVIAVNSVGLRSAPSKPSPKGASAR